MVEEQVVRWVECWVECLVELLAASMDLMSVDCLEWNLVGCWVVLSAVNSVAGLVVHLAILLVDLMVDQLVVNSAVHWAASRG